MYKKKTNIFSLIFVVVGYIYQAKLLNKIKKKSINTDRTKALEELVVVVVVHRMGVVVVDNIDIVVLAVVVIKVVVAWLVEIAYAIDLKNQAH
jgi:hypothetical protein